MPITFNPVFVLALGGTGTQVARELRERLAWRYGDAHLPFVRFLFIDTDNNNPEAAGPDGILINTSQGQVDRMLTNPDDFAHIGLKDWVDMEALKRADKGGFAQGAGGVRMYGRLALLASPTFQNMWQQIAQRIREIRAVNDTEIKKALGIDPNQQVEVGAPRCYVISSSCGGTGAGTFIDIGYVLHSIRSQEDVLDADRIGILAIARQDAISERQYTRNTAAMLTELDYYNRSGVVYKVKFPQQPAQEFKEAPYDWCYLVSPSGPKGPVPFDQFLHRISEYIYLDIIAQTAEARSRRTDFGVNMNEYDADGYPLRFLTFGVASIEFPADACHKACFYGTICEFVRTWLQTDARRIANDGTTPTEPENREEAELRAFVGCGAVKPGDDPVLEQLTTVSEGLESFAGGKRPHDWMNEQITRTFDGEPTAESLAELERRLEQCLAKDGYFTRCVEENTRRLRASRWLEKRVLEKIIPVVFDLKRGPRRALGLVRALKKALASEQERIDKELHVPISSAYTLDQARSAVEAIRRDWILRIPPAVGFPWINEHAVKRELKKPRELICDYYNRRVERLILTAKKDLYAELLEPALATLEQRLTHLLEYLVQWHNEASEEYNQIMSRPLDQRTGMLFGEEIVQQKMDRVMMDVDERNRDKFMRALLEEERVQTIREALEANLDGDKAQPFTGDMPKDAARGGRIQLKYVQPIQEYIRQRYREHAPAGQPPIIYDERVIERFQEAATRTAGLGAEIASVVEESMELADLNLQHPKYADLQTPTPRHGWWAFFNGARAENQWTEFKRELSNAVGAAGGRTGVIPSNSYQWLQEIDDPYMVVLLLERSAFPTRIIRGYDIEEREEKITGSHAVEGVVPEITAFSRTGILARPPAERDIREAERVFLGAVLLGIMDPDPNRGKFSVELPRTTGMPRQLLELPADFNLAVDNLAYSPQRRTILGSLVQQRITADKDAVQTTLSAVQERITLTDDQAAASHEMEIRGIRGLDDARAYNIIQNLEVHFGLRVGGSGQPLDFHPYADYKPDPPAGRRPGYYCRNASCGVFLGTELQDIPPQCPNCKKSFVPLSGA
jgi:hypothetical protein